MRARPPISFPPGTRLTLLCMSPRSARSSSSCWVAAVGGAEGSSGCGTGMGLLGRAESEGCYGFHPEAGGCLGLRILHPRETLPFPHRQHQGTGGLPGDKLAGVGGWPATCGREGAAGSPALTPAVLQGCRIQPPHPSSRKDLQEAR